MINLITNVASEALSSIAISIIGLLVACSVYLLNKIGVNIQMQMKAIKEEEKRKLFTNALVDVEFITSKVVKAMEQTKAKGIREYVKADMLDKSVLEDLAEEAARDIKLVIKEDTKKVITENINNFELYLKNVIESKVLEMKMQMSREKIRV